MNIPQDYPGLDAQPGSYENEGWAKRHLRRFFRSQFGKPSGLFGIIAGRIMARTPSNHARMEWTVSLLGVKSTDRVLEIGFGPGFAIKAVSLLAKDGFVAGIDHSDVMVRQASRRNAQGIRDGRVELRQGSVSGLPEYESPFDKIYTINSIHFWEEPVECLKALRRLLVENGTIAVTLQPRSRTATDESTRTVGEELADKLRLAGFGEVRLEVKNIEPRAVACVIGKNISMQEEGS